MRFRKEFPGIKRYPRFRTIDSTQGGENEIVLLEFTPTDQYNGAIIAFLYKWNRINVAISSAKSCLIVFGNLNHWRSQLAVITQGYRARNFCYLMIDLLDLGDVIDVESNNFLPRSYVEFRDGRSTWIMGIKKTLAQDSRLSCHGQSIMNLSYTTQEAKNMHEQQYLFKLKELRVQAKAYKEIEPAGGECQLPAFETTEEEIDIEVDELEDE